MYIAYYISDYGYGHATRSVAIIRELLKSNENLNLIICHSFAQKFLQESLRDSRVTFRTLETDIGYILNPQTLELDHLKIQDMYEEYLVHRKRKIKGERDFLTEKNIDYIISDIYSTAIEAAYDLNIPSIGISNFLWSDVYKNIISDSKLKVMQEAYAKMTYYLPLKGQINSKRYMNTFDFFSREINHSEVRKIKSKLNISLSDIVIFYGLGMKIDHSTQFDNDSSLWSTEGCKFIVSSHIDISHPNVFRIPNDYTETQNYIAASDFTITKPGWSTVSESINGSSNLLLIKRDSFIEDQNTIDALNGKANYHVISLEKLNHSKFKDTLLMKHHKKFKPTSSGMREIIKKLNDIMSNY
ncbi:hypothetical protein [Exiguobacterium undae]|uniref:Glycosyl transferase family 28 C-terminal domain-containing protein n=1 Tax=Exiguobacterium undae TaxID=169177 RepID=A0ABX2V814_9BACL|nr:hypothetical protein [Exiguobacterium undae]OAN14373.1 hypothetical protein A3783_00165 [Exiguobacterium undae]